MSLSLLALSVIWNAFLAIIPVALAYSIERILGRQPRSTLSVSVAALLGLVWLGFLPNTCYLVTEWRHFLEYLDRGDLFLRSQYDNVLLVKLCAFSLFYMLYSGFGLLAYAMAIRPISRAIQRLSGDPRTWAIPLFLASSLGVYLGLVLRFNSWDLAANPAKVWNEIVEVSHRPALTLFIAGFGVFLWVCYRAVDIWIEGFHLTTNGNSRKL
ncbi:MAG: DUF1361 domain-containing protein [Armatimonadetes bacterium]|nr:DUF1361 domain-containing protein [Armatimonadota bacterium]